MVSETLAIRQHSGRGHYFRFDRTFISLQTAKAWRKSVIVILHLINTLLAALADDRSAMFLWNSSSVHLRMPYRWDSNAYLPFFFTYPKLVERA
jgi:hypothetical protein